MAAVRDQGLGFCTALGEVPRNPAWAPGSNASHAGFLCLRKRPWPLLPHRLSPGLTHIEDVEGQPVEEGVTDQLGKEQTQRELHHTLGGRKGGMMERGGSAPPRVPHHLPQKATSNASAISVKAVCLLVKCCIKASLPCHPPQESHRPSASQIKEFWGPQVALSTPSPDIQQKNLGSFSVPPSHIFLTGI